MAIHFLKENDTLPVLSTVLRNPDGSPFDLTNTDNVYLHIVLADGTELTNRSMDIAGDPLTGGVTYPWVVGDWAANNLVASPAAPAQDHQVEYETVGVAGRLTFPNGGHDTLHIEADIGQGA